MAKSWALQLPSLSLVPKIQPRRTPLCRSHKVTICSSLLEETSESSRIRARRLEDEKAGLCATLLGLHAPLLLFQSDIAMAAEEAGPGYSAASYYTSLGLFVLALPGLWSLIKRSAKSKIVRKTYVVPGPSQESGKAPKQIAGEISSFFTRNNFTIVDSGEVVRFEGLMVPSRGQAAFIIFCTFLSLASAALVLTITVPVVGDKWYWLTAFSPLAGAYYWTNASRKEEIQVKLVVADDESSTDVLVQGDDEQIEQLRKELGFMEKGMVYVKGILQ
ncbi:protein COFACTOR ASSEMBLY OF COMPLEX C SUBUNIT B CCB1, chloroplastic [Selaginella moellendorffii]|nr:protein COFACTOR ASSEMBLY OF COMPLEX C SUBUNIT B CCB1, chloroplastic [Selaginella moellendorffii]XP_024533939.1 protein COFACTOR ASSEMBLY OF COMPLEX C SUBUNIT B CCB1, chloroplastic [Selaginella moellendorffii]|eukprot:XP_002973398.2 protein COFACTOR ASSEMBLY OF COMPLEX C SUBUNIT B CCB1, chloroplastic [Selaginella moellendorffii]